MKIELNVKNFRDEIAKHPAILVYFFQEKGCRFCDIMKPYMEKYAEENILGVYALGDFPDEVTKEFCPNQAVPRFWAFVDGKPVGFQSGAMPIEEVVLAFTPEKIPPKQMPIEKMSMAQLITDECFMIDQIAPMMSLLKKIQKEIKKRKMLLIDEPCCDSCADGGTCSGGCK